MKKIQISPGTYLFPVPAVCVSCGTMESPNIITIAWAGTVCSSPPMVSISVRPSRHSYNLIRESGEFVINIPRSSQVKIVDACGTTSGRITDKFMEFNLTPEPSGVVSSPLIQEFPVNIECRVKDIIELGVHHLFLSEIVNVNADEDIYNDGFDVQNINPLIYCVGEYFAENKKLGSYGFSKQGNGK